DRRRAILLFEATEGGAGVLGRLAADPLALAQVARAALELMHYRNIDAAAAAASVDDLAEAPDARCVVGCYRCLLSYYNQPDQEDAAFDCGLVSFADDGTQRASPKLSQIARTALGLDAVSPLRDLKDAHRANLLLHRTRHGF